MTLKMPYTVSVYPSAVPFLAVTPLLFYALASFSIR